MRPQRKKNSAVIAYFLGAMQLDRHITAFRFCDPTHRRTATICAPSAFPPNSASNHPRSTIRNLLYFFARRTHAASFLIGGATRPNAVVSCKKQSQVTMIDRNNPEALRIPTSARRPDARSSNATQLIDLSTAFAGRL
jgi:hypothetical protein